MFLLGLGSVHNGMKFILLWRVSDRAGFPFSKICRQAKIKMLHSFK